MLVVWSPKKNDENFWTEQEIQLVTLTVGMVLDQADSCIKNPVLSVGPSHSAHVFS